jgi:hypothetical protein
MMLAMMVSMMSLLKMVAKAHVERAQDKEQDDSSSEDHVIHKIVCS